MGTNDLQKPAPSFCRVEDSFFFAGVGGASLPQTLVPTRRHCVTSQNLREHFRSHSSIFFFLSFFFFFFLWRVRSCGLFPFQNESESCEFYRKLERPLGRGISPSQGSCLHKTASTETMKTQPCLQWSSYPLSQSSSRRKHFLLQTAWPLWSAELLWQKSALKICNVE
jgi:hypothetical protein